MAEYLPSPAADTLIKQCGLTDADCNKEIRKSHLEKICRSFCNQWRLLPPQLEVGPAVMEKLEQDYPEEQQKRAFFLQWKEMKGPGASYKRLISALLAVGCKEDAESVCRLLWEYVSTRTIPSMKPKYGMYFGGKTASDCRS